MVRRRRGGRQRTDRRGGAPRRGNRRADDRCPRAGGGARLHRSPYPLGDSAPAGRLGAEQGPAGRDARRHGRELVGRTARRTPGRNRRRRHAGLVHVHRVLRAARAAGDRDQRDRPRVVGAGAPRGDGLRRAPRDTRRTRAHEGAGRAVHAGRRVGPGDALRERRPRTPRGDHRPREGRRRLRRQLHVTHRQRGVRAGEGAAVRYPGRGRGAAAGPHLPPQDSRARELGDGRQVPWR